MPAVTSGNEGAPFIEPVYARREMKAYAVTENEIAIIFSLNFEKTVFFAIGTFFASIVLTIILNTAFSTGQLSPQGQVISTWGLYVSAIIMAVFYVLGIITLCRAKSAWQTIKNESVNPSLPA